MEEPLQMNQKVIVIPIESETDLEETAAGGLQQYANPSLVSQEKDVWRKAAIKNMRMDKCILDANAIL